MIMIILLFIKVPVGYDRRAWVLRNFFDVGQVVVEDEKDEL